MIIKLTNDNYLDYAKIHYNGLRVENSDDFSMTLRTISRIRKIFTDGINDKHRLVLNYIIILTNSFGIIPTANLLFFLIPDEFHETTRTFLSFLGCYDSDDIDVELMQKLKDL